MPLDSILDSFKFKFSEVKTIDRNKDYELLKYKKINNTFIIDAPEGRELASDPSVVGHLFDLYNLSLGRKAAEIMNSMGLFDNEILYLDVLRAAPGYRLFEGINTRGHKINIKKISIRPKYIKASYQHHTYNKLNIEFSDIKEINRECKILIKPDTEASGKTSIKVMEYILKKCEDVDCKIEKVILYGFISHSSLNKLTRMLQSKGINIYTFAIEDITALSSNGYDMPVYGIDIINSEKLLTAVTSYEILDKMYDKYFPGLDQPGDWSERQTLLFNGKTYEKGVIEKHLRSSLINLISLRNKSKACKWYQPEYEVIYDSMRTKLSRNTSGYDFC